MKTTLFTLSLLCAAAGCSSTEPAVADVEAAQGAGQETDDLASDGPAPADEAPPAAPDGAAATATAHTYGTSADGRALRYHKLVPAAPNGRKALLTFAVHGFEDAWSQDGRALDAIGRFVIDRYKANSAALRGWTLYVVPSGNPDGMHEGVNNFREGKPGAFGRCTAQGKDLNRNFGTGTFAEQKALRALVDAIKPTVLVDFHGWYNTYYGDARVGKFFAQAFNADYPGKPERYCYVSGAGQMDCGDALGGVFHANPNISQGLLVEWARSARGIDAALVEYPAPDFNGDGNFDKVYDASLGHWRMGNITLGKMRDRTFVALDNLFDDY